jgi:hypothetical protein
MKHAGQQTLQQLEELLARVRTFHILREKKPGTFYQKSKAFLHFHEDQAGIFADLWNGDDWERLRVSTTQEQKAFLRRVASLVGE